MNPPFSIVYKSNPQYREEYGFWLKPMCDFSGMTAGHDKGFAWHTSWGSALPAPDLGTPMQRSLGGELQSRTGPLLTSHALSHTFPVPEPSFLGLSI